MQPTKPNYTVTWEEAEKIIIPADGFEVEINMNCHAKGELPNLDGELLRPNIVMFCDFGWMPVREEAQHQSYVRWRNASDLSRVVVIECGAGTQIPTMRFFGEELADSNKGTLIRVNPDKRESQISSHLWDNLNEKTSIPIAMRAKDALLEIEKEMGVF